MKTATGLRTHLLEAGGNGAHAPLQLLDDHVEVNFDHLTPEEVGNVLAASWWTPAALAGVAFKPPDLPEMMSSALTAYAGRPR